MRARTVGLGCLAIPALALLIGIIVFAAAFFMGPVDITPTSKQLDQAVPWSAVPDSIAPDAVTDAPVRVLDVVLQFEEGAFEIVPGLPGSPIHLEAEYDEGAYRLRPEYHEDAAGDRFTLTFERSASLAGLRQLVHREEDLQDNFVRVLLPPGVPMRLEVRMAKGEAQFDLSGLSLVSLRLETKMGSTQVEMDRVNPVPMEYCDIRSQMGEMRFYGLGFAAPAALTFQGRMGGYLLDLEGPGRDRLDARFEILMGELRVEVPRGVAIDVQEQHVLLGEMESRGGGPRAAEGDTRQRLNVEARVRLGNLILD